MVKTLYTLYTSDPSVAAANCRMTSCCNCSLFQTTVTWSHGPMVCRETVVWSKVYMTQLCF